MTDLDLAAEAAELGIPLTFEDPEPRHSSRLPDDFIAALRNELEGTRKLKHKTPADLAAAIDAGYLRMPHTEYLSERLAAAVEKVKRGKSQALIVSMPPRSGKTQTAANHLPLWLLHHMPSWNVGYVTRESNLATKSGRAVRRLIEEHGLALELSLIGDRKAASAWETTKGGGMSAYGVSSNITGHGFEVLLLDDLVRDFATAHSEADRDSLWDWFTTTAFNRLHPPGLLIAIGTRWHEDDWLGRLEELYLSEDAPGDLEVIRFPALAVEEDVLGRVPGEPLLSPLVRKTLLEGEVEEEKNLAHWKSQRQVVGEYAWAAEYQQDPTPAGGDIFQTSWWRTYTDAQLPERFDRVLTSWDLAFKGTKTSDYVVGQKWGVAGADYYLLDQVRGQWSFTETIQKMIPFCDGINENLIEDKANGPAVIDTLRQRVSGIIPITPKDSKEARARSVSPLIEAGNVHLPAKAGYLRELRGELDSFPNAKHDDQVDALTQALHRVRPGHRTTSTDPHKALQRRAEREREKVAESPQTRARRAPRRGSIYTTRVPR